MVTKMHPPSELCIENGDARLISSLRSFMEAVLERLDMIAHVLRCNPIRFNHLKRKVQEQPDPYLGLQRAIQQIEEELLLLSRVLRIDIDFEDLEKFTRILRFRFRKPLVQTKLDKWMQG